MKRALLALGFILAALAAVLAIDRAIVARQNVEIISPKEGFVRWPSGTLYNPLASERREWFDWLSGSSAVFSFV